VINFLARKHSVLVSLIRPLIVFLITWSFSLSLQGISRPKHFYQDDMLWWLALRPSYGSVETGSIEAIFIS
jgi:hypothetical protein